MYLQGSLFYSGLLLSHALLLKRKSAVGMRQIDNFFLASFILLEACGDPGYLLLISVRLKEDGKTIYELVFTDHLIPLSTSMNHDDCLHEKIELQ